MPEPQHPKPLSVVVRQSDGARLGLFATEDAANPLLAVEEGEDGGFDMATGRLMPFAECFALLSLINEAAGLN